MWVAGITQGLMWREYDDQGFLVNSFVETVDAIHWAYVARAFGGMLYLLGALVMAWNVANTILGRQRAEAPIGGALPSLAVS
jgi:cytochrome c oxidase cbb3-type subunit 1